jgi:hypothetical protein
MIARTPDSSHPRDSRRYSASSQGAPSRGRPGQRAQAHLERGDPQAERRA